MRSVADNENKFLSLQELDEKLGYLNKKLSEFEIRSIQVTSELKQSNAGLAARNEVLERQLIESLTEYKREVQILEARYVEAEKEYRADFESKTKRLEREVHALKAKVFVSTDLLLNMVVSVTE